MDFKDIQHVIFLVKYSGLEVYNHLLAYCFLPFRFRILGLSLHLKTVDYIWYYDDFVQQWLNSYTIILSLCSFS